mmetsp:Transcript_7743/g.11690  ORF Transcript_7743/g.11690 Transcript_7743/m.11690 type:complete len:105 (+) Transcript_7743:401-715(+)
MYYLLGYHQSSSMFSRDSVAALDAVARKKSAMTGQRFCFFLWWGKHTYILRMVVCFFLLTSFPLLVLWFVLIVVFLPFMLPGYVYVCTASSIGGRNKSACNEME